MKNEIYLSQAIFFLLLQDIEEYIEINAAEMEGVNIRAEQLSFISSDSLIPRKQIASLNKKFKMVSSQFEQFQRPEERGKGLSTNTLILFLLGFFHMSFLGEGCKITPLLIFLKNHFISQIFGIERVQPICIED